MQRAVAVVLCVVLFAPAVFAAPPAGEEPRFSVKKFLKRVVTQIGTLDELLTGGKP